MATKYQRGSRWYLNWHDEAGQHRKSLGPISEYEAETRRQDKDLELRTGQTQFAPSIVFGVLAVRYLDWHAGAFPDSHDRIKYIVERRLVDFHDRPVSAITQREIEEWVSQEAGRRLRSGELVAPDTVAKELRTLKAVLRKGIQWGLLDRSPAVNVQAPKNLKSEPIRWYTAAELAKLYEVDPIHAATWKLMANTGLRRREAMNLLWTDVKGVNLHIRSEHGARTKSGKFRIVPISPGAKEALVKLWADRGTSNKILPPMTKQSWTRAFAKAAHRAKLDGSLHSLRHTFAANLVSAGVSLRVVQVLCGHATIAVTERYAHVAPGALAAAVAELSL